SPVVDTDRNRARCLWCVRSIARPLLALRPCWSVETRLKESSSSRGRADREHVARGDSTHRDGELAVERDRPRARRLLTDRGPLGGDRLLECGQQVIALHPGPPATVLDTLR